MNRVVEVRRREVRCPKVYAGGNHGEDLGSVVVEKGARYPEEHNRVESGEGFVRGMYVWFVHFSGWD